MRENVGSILVNIEGANLEDDLDKAVNEGDDKVDSGQSREGEAVPHKLNGGRQGDIVPYLLHAHGWLKEEFKELPLGRIQASEKTQGLENKIKCADARTVQPQKRRA